MKKFYLAAAIVLLTAANLRAQLNVYFVNVGQGGAIYLEFPDGTNALIDGGSSGESIYQFLKDKGVTKLDRVVLTHPHGDHYRGLKKVFTSFEVDKYYDTRAENVDAQGDNNCASWPKPSPAAAPSTRSPAASSSGTAM